MFQLLKDPNYDLVGKRRIALAISAVVVATSIALVSTKGLNKGIEFTGGTEIQVKFADTPDLGTIRSRLSRLGGSTPVVTTIGDPANNEVYIKLGSGGEDTDQTDLTGTIKEKLQPADPQQRDLLDLNTDDAQTVALRLARSPEISEADATALAEAILAHRKEVAILHSLDDLAGLEGMTPEARRLLEEQSFVGPFAIRSQSYIGPVIGKELMRKAQLAILGSLLGMLVYIWIRFRLQWGFAAVVAVAHDTIVTLGLFALFGKELNLPVVAAFLTLVGYSVNDTVVVFDRIRENLHTMGTRNLETIVNRSINQTLSRTILTTGSTWLVVVGLFIYGGEALGAFAFVLTVGVLVGTYSSVFIASPIVIAWQEFAERRKGARTTEPATRRTAKKVRTTAAR